MRMDWEAVGAIGEVLGALVVGVTLAFLAVQIRQNTRSVEAASFQSGVDGTNQLNNLIAHDESMARIIRLGNESLDNPTEDEQVRYGFMNLSGLRSFESMHFHHLHGTGRDLWVSHAQHIGRHFAHPGVRQWWVRNQLAFTPEFTKFVEQELAEAKAHADDGRATRF